jgi:hypothetical protein
MRKYLIKKSLIVGIIILFTISNFASSLSDISENTMKIDVDYEKSYDSEEKVVISCQTYGRLGKSLRQTVMAKTEAEEILNKINEFARIIGNNPLSDETERMQGEIISLAKDYGLLPINTSFVDFQPRFFTKLESFQPKKGISPVVGNRGTASFCNFVTTGSGMQFPIIILPRLIPILLTPIPRAFLHWSANEGFTSCGSYLTGTGFMAGGMQRGTALGFWGIGFSIFIPPVMAYGFIGYALFVTCTAEEMESWPPNNPPIISNEHPSNWEYNVPKSLSELSFKIEDPDGDEMNYKVTTEPDIGSDNKKNMKDGNYSVSISSLESNKTYIWTVELTDKIDTTEKEFTFYTGEPPNYILFSDDFDDNSKDFNKWTEVFTEGLWVEQNQRAEFQLYEPGPGPHKFEGLESTEINTQLNTVNPLIINWDIITNIKSTNWAGSLFLKITDETNWLKAEYSRWLKATRYQDSNDGERIILNDNKPYGTYSNEIQLFSDRYIIQMDTDSTGPIYDALFSLGTPLKIQIYIESGGDQTDLYFRSGFDNVIVRENK